jgi:hypothetical protein
VTGCAAERGDGRARADGAVLAHAAAGHADVVQRGGAAGAAGAGGRAGRGALPHVAAGGRLAAPQHQRAHHLQPHHVHHRHRRLHQPLPHLRLQLRQCFSLFLFYVDIFINLLTTSLLFTEKLVDGIVKCCYL